MESRLSSLAERVVALESPPRARSEPCSHPSSTCFSDRAESEPSLVLNTFLEGTGRENIISFVEGVLANGNIKDGFKVAPVGKFATRASIICMQTGLAERIQKLWREPSPSFSGTRVYIGWQVSPEREYDEYVLRKCFAWLQQVRVPSVEKDKARRALYIGRKLAARIQDGHLVVSAAWLRTLLVDQFRAFLPDEQIIREKDRFRL